MTRTWEQEWVEGVAAFRDQARGDGIILSFQVIRGRDFDTTMNVLAKAIEKGPWLMGDQFTVADVLIGSNIRWSTIFKMIPERKEFTDYIVRIAARPAAQRAEAKDKELSAQAA